MRQFSAQIWPEINSGDTVSPIGSSSIPSLVEQSDSPDNTEQNEQNFTGLPRSGQSDMVLTDIPEELEFPLRFLIVVGWLL